VPGALDRGDQLQPPVERECPYARGGELPRRRGDTLWGPEALTPSERRVAELAMEGLTTREMAESLFVTPKTVEFHLRHIYQKLGVNSRDKLSGALGIDG
jgi:DNA-binding CsgD family transcriptional regulator